MLYVRGLASPEDVELLFDAVGVKGAFRRQDLLPLTVAAPYACRPVKRVGSTKWWLIEPDIPSGTEPPQMLEPAVSYEALMVAANPERIALLRQFPAKSLTGDIPVPFTAIRWVLAEGGVEPVASQGAGWHFDYAPEDEAELAALVFSPLVAIRP